MSNMARNQEKLNSRFRGALMGLAVGDALGFPYRGRSRSFLGSLPDVFSAGFARHESGFYPPGQISDDTQTTLAVASAIVEASAVRGEIIVEHLVPLWRDHLVVDRPEFTSEVLERLLKGEIDVTSSGLPVGHLESDALPRAVPIGLWSHDDLVALPEHAEICTSITHRDPRLVAAASGVAAAVAYAVSSGDVLLGEILDRMASGAGRFFGELAEWILDFPRILSLTEYRAFDQIQKWVSKHGGLALEGYHAGVPDNGLFVFLVSIYYFLKSPFDFERALTLSIKAGGEVPTLCGVVGSLSGAFLGEEAIPSFLVESVLQRDSILSIAGSFVETWKTARSAC